MANKLPPLPQGVSPGSGYWNDWYEKLRTLVNTIVGTGVPWSLVTATPTTLLGYGITDGESLSNKNIVGGYAALNGVSRVTMGVDTQDDLIVDNTVKGLVLKSPNGTYFRAQISNAGVLSWTNLGTTKP
jgi:hypothetical protein